MSSRTSKLVAYSGEIMEIATSGKVDVVAKVENLADLHLVVRGVIPDFEVRRVEVSNALVDTGATCLGMPKRFIAQLGLRPLRTRQARTSAGIVTMQIYGSVRLTVQGRDCLSDVTELPEGCPILIGQVPLEILDFVVDPAGQRLIGNPRSRRRADARILRIHYGVSSG